MEGRAVYTLGTDEGAAAVRRMAVAGKPSGLGWLPNGDLLVAEMESRRILRFAGGVGSQDAPAVHADLSGEWAFLANDMVVSRDGRAFVGNFGMSIKFGPPKEMRKTTMVIVKPDGTVAVAADELLFPNGCVLLDEGRTLVVAETFGNVLTAFDVAADGTLGGRRVWCVACWVFDVCFAADHYHYRARHSG